MSAVNQRYPVLTEWSEEDEMFVATSSAFPGLTGVNPSEELAVAELREAIGMTIDVMLEDGETPPALKVRASHSGQFRLRLPKTMHATLALRAEEEGVSLNQLAMTYIAMGLGQHPAHAAVNREASTA
jgi:predicted HicB family RNase H-like nuclease